jgi:phosphomannomutase
MGGALMRAVDWAAIGRCLQSPAMQVTPSIFKAYDIRGTTPTTLNEAVAEGLGLAFGTQALALGERVVAVGRDGRLSGPRWRRRWCGLVAAGVQVIDIGMVTTPMLYFAAHTLCSSGIQVTGSHNPRDDNGFKMVLAGRAIYGEDIQALRRMMEAESWQRRAGGSVRAHDVYPAYRDRIARDIHLARPMKLVVDCGNGVAGASAPAVLRAIGCEVMELFTEVDGAFPTTTPIRPSPRTCAMSSQPCKAPTPSWAWPSTATATGWASSPRTGRPSFPTGRCMLFAQDVLSRAPGGTIVYDVKCTQRLGPAIAAAGGVPLMYKTGHSLIKARMKELDAPLGGEMSGHIFFKERWYGFDDGTYAGARLLEILSRSPDASAVLNALPTSFSTPELNVACAEGEPHRLAAELQALAASVFAAPALSAAGPPGANAPSGAANHAKRGAWGPLLARLTACAWTGPTALA